jgi:carboxymethylenebutenolidase
MPICGSYGQRDDSIPAPAVQVWTEALHVPHDVRIYPEAGHAFFDDQRASYSPRAAADAWSRVVKFFGDYLLRGW